VKRDLPHGGISHSPDYKSDKQAAARKVLDESRQFRVDVDYRGLALRLLDALVKIRDATDPVDNYDEKLQTPFDISIGAIDDARKAGLL